MSKSVKIEWEVWSFPYIHSGTPILEDSGGINVTKGIVSVSFSRSKSSVSNSCNISVVGPPSKAMVLGSWIVVRSYMKVAKDILPRFIGQIYSASTDYTTDVSGFKHRVTNYQVREWSAALESPVRFDLSSIAGTSLALEFDAPSAIFQNQQLSKKFGVSDLLSQQNESRTAYSMARYILGLVGGIVSSNSEAKPILGVTMPSIPKSVAVNLGLNSSSYNPISPYATGFMESVLGYMPWPAQYQNGVLPLGFNNSNIYAESTTSHPAVIGYGNRLSMGFSVWELLNTLCNPVLNEVFTDIVYKYNSSGGLTGQPTLFVRCKPFTLKKDFSVAFPTLTEKSFYDDLPRTTIDPEYIVSARLSFSLEDSPTYFRILPIEDGLNNPAFNAIDAKVAGTGTLRTEAVRFGGKEMDFQTSFVSQGVSLGNLSFFDLKTWLSGMVSLAKLWYGMNYRLPEMTLILKDENLPFSIGSNVDFEFRGRTLVGHLEAYYSDVRVLANGMKTSNSTLRLSRVVELTEAGTLDYLPETALSELFIG